MTPKEDQQPMTTREDALAKPAQDFLDKVDRGEARSVKSYAASKAALHLAYLDNVMEEAAKAAFRQAQSVYRGEYDHFPLTNTWDNAGEKVRDSWRRIAAAACGARKFDALKLEQAIAETLAPYFEVGFTARDGAQALMRLLRDEALRLASRQEVSVEELASIYGQTLATDLLANYAITKRTTEG